MGVRKLKSQQNAVLDINGHGYELPVFQGTESECALDISKLRAETGYVTLDPAYGNTGACLSGITFLDGEKGILRYRGYPIEELAEKSGFVEVASLLMNGELPSSESLQTSEKTLTKRDSNEEFLGGIIRQFPRDTHPMAIAGAAMVALSGRYPEFCGQSLSPGDRLKVSDVLLRQIKNITCEIYRHREGLEPAPPKDSLNFVQDFLHRMYAGTPHATDNPEIEKAVNILLILHADHEQNCSTSTVRLVGSSGANPFTTFSAGISALWGPLHGGANQAVIEMLQEIHKAGGVYKSFLARAKDKNDSYRLMGFGHRVYKNFDPRATIIKASCDKDLQITGTSDPLLDIAKGLEEEALKDPYFSQRKLYPNVDFYSGIIYKALNIPVDMFTVMFALGRAPGWLAQWNEMVSEGSRIGRPRQIYNGPTLRHYPSGKG